MAPPRAAAPAFRISPMTTGCTAARPRRSSQRSRPDAPESCRRGAPRSAMAASRMSPSTCFHFRASSMTPQKPKQARRSSWPCALHVTDPMAKATRRSVRRISRTTSGFTAVISLRSKRRSAMDATARCRRGTRSSAPIAFVWSRRGFWRNRPTRRRRTTSARHECRSRAIESEIRARAAGRALRRGRVAILFRRGRGDDDVLRDCRSGGTGGDDLAADDDLSRGGLHDRILHVLGVHVLVESVHRPSFDRADQRRADRSRCAMIKTIPLALVEGDDGALYAKQPKVYPREIDGRFQRLRIAAVFWLLGMFYV